jgi:FkbM family methyltransferase
MYLTGDEKILEIGGNIGRNSLIIASILKNSSDLVSLECSPYISAQLTQNRDANHLGFHIENSALSNRKLIQREWETFPMVNNVIPNGYTEVKTITLNDMKQKYTIVFDTLVLDCEGAFYYILMDTPEILNGINLIIMENDYHIIEHKHYIDKVLLENNFYRDYVEGGGWGACENNFFEVWKKNI